MSILSRILSALKGEPEPPPHEETSADGDRIRALQRQGMWDLAAGELERLGDGVFASVELLTLWMQTECVLERSSNITADHFRRLIELDAPPERLVFVFKFLDEEVKLEVCEEFQYCTRGLKGFEKKQALSLIPLERWSAQALYEELASTQDPARWDEVYDVAQRNYMHDKRFDMPPKRPLTSQERQAELERLRARDRAKREKARQAKRGPEAQNTELEEKLFAGDATPDDYLVYADWLQIQGDRRGELIAIQVERERRPDDEDLQRSERKLLDDLAPGLLGEIASYPSVVSHFQRGFLRGLKVEAADTETSAALILERLLEVPERYYLRNLVVGLPTVEDAYYADVIDVLTEGGRELIRLRSLFLGDVDYQTSWIELGLLEPMYPSLPHLEVLKLHAGYVEVGDIDLPHLRELTIQSVSLPVESLDSMCDAKWPELERLELWLGPDDYAERTIVDCVSNLLKTDFPRLHHLGLRNTELTANFLDLLRDAPLTARLRTLDLSMGCLTSAYVDRLVETMDAFAHLENLDLSRNCLDEAAAARLAKFPNVTLHDQEPDRSDGVYVYVPVSE